MRVLIRANVTDIFFLKADICQLGVDQRKVNMLAREYCDSAGIKNKPIILSHHMLYGLKKGQEKMSKSDPDSAIFMEDTVEDVARKLNNAYCPATAEEEEQKAPAEGEEIDAGLESMHLVENDLKNPCLDYVENILFSVPDQVFKCGGVDYTSFSAVKEAFVGGKMDEATLKAALVDAVNALLDPVRKHFSENAEAKALLAQMIEWKKADLKPPTGLKRLVATDSTQGPVWAVVAPPACENLTVGELTAVLRQLSAAPADQQLVLWCPDWTSFVLNKCGGDQKVIGACYTLLCEALRAVQPALMARVTVMLQSEAILKDPSQYWISVINVGRYFQLQRVREVDEANEYAGQVIAALMHVGDVLALAPATLACTAGSSMQAAHELAAAYIAETNVTEIPKPEVHAMGALDSLLKPPHMLEGPGNADDDVFVLDGTMDVGRKMKRAFCEPGNIQHCPPITLSEACLFTTGAKLDIARKEENGGDKTYSNVDELQADFKSGALHPGDLKPFVTKAVDAFLQNVRDRCKRVETAKKAEADVRAYLKKLAAASKKKK